MRAKLALLIFLRFWKYYFRNLNIFEHHDKLENRNQQLPNFRISTTVLAKIAFFKIHLRIICSAFYYTHWAAVCIFTFFTIFTSHQPRGVYSCTTKVKHHTVKIYIGARVGCLASSGPQLNPTGRAVSSLDRGRRRPTVVCLPNGGFGRYLFMKIIHYQT